MNWSQQSAHFPGSQLEACCFHDRKLSFWKAALPPCLLSLYSSLCGAALGPPTSPKVRLASTEMPGRCLYGPNANSLCVEVMCIWITSARTWLWKYAALSSSPEPTSWAQGLKDDLFPSQYLAVYFCPPSFHVVALSLGRYLLHCSFPASLSFQTRGLLPPPFSLVTTFHRDGETQAYGIVWWPRTNYENIHDCPDSVNQPVWRHTGPTWDLTLTWARCPLFQLTLGALQHPVWLFKDFQCLHWRETSLGGISVSCNSLDKYFLLKRRRKVTLASLLQNRLSQVMSSAQAGMGAGEVLCPAEGMRRMVPPSVTFPLNLAHHLTRPPQPPQTNPHSTKWPGRGLHSCWGYWKQGWSGKLP